METGTMEIMGSNSTDPVEGAQSSFTRGFFCSRSFRLVLFTSPLLEPPAPPEGPSLSASAKNKSTFAPSASTAPIM